MARHLSLVLSVLLVASSTVVQAVGGRRGLFFLRDIRSDFETCRGSGIENDMLTRFTGIFFGDFYTGGSQDILGSLAVEGNMHAPNYIVNANHGTDCTSPNSLNSYGLVVGGVLDTFNTHVHGNTFIAGGGDVEEVLQLDQGCYVTDQQGTGIFDFAVAKDLLQSASKDFADHPATNILEPDGSLTNLRTVLSHYEILTFHSCQAASCSSDLDTESDPTAIFLGIGNWNGIQGSSKIDPEKTYVLNIPVTNGATFEMNTNNPTNGFNPCNLVYNIYPVDANGNFMADGEFTLIRRTANQLGGFTLAPRGHIVDGSIGNFAGNIVGLDYTWENLGAGVEIHDYVSAGGRCDEYLGCVPVHITSYTPTTVAPPTDTSITQSRTRTWSTTVLVNPTNIVRKVISWKNNFVKPTITVETTITTRTRTFTRTRTRTSRVPIPTTLSTTFETISTIPITLPSQFVTTVTITSGSETTDSVSTGTTDITTFKEETTTVTDPTSTIYSETTITEETTEDSVTTETETETMDIISDTTCVDGATNIVTVESTETETIGEHTDTVTVSVPADGTTVVISSGILTTADTSMYSVTDYVTATRRKFMLKPVTRTVTNCNIDSNTCTTATICDTEPNNTDETSTDHHGHHHGKDEDCNEDDDDEKDYPKDKKNWDDDEDDEDDGEYDDYEYEKY